MNKRTGLGVLCLMTALLGLCHVSTAAGKYELTARVAAVAVK